MNLSDLYKQIVLNHARNRRNQKEPISYTHKIHYKNPTCGDVMTMYATINDNIVEELFFNGDGCFISMASSSMFTTIAKNKSIKELEELSHLMHEMIVKGIEVEDLRLDDTLSLRNIHKLPARYNCALMPWQAFCKLIKGS
ncbi:Fe-S cluster assembly sulfur transfer protein SufU [Sutcliffiella halmapala]|uniref:Fe-S cluster assembly sulfur transfer protein SufU n=1 Tax=Sutcliffiella halmapala TaxID=79882 RepID=UPI000994CB9A|nr:SUF system NifU family Fe-S cluster assembly protein [Sutcliffiella halmapala]